VLCSARQRLYKQTYTTTFNTCFTLIYEFLFFVPTMIFIRRSALRAEARVCDLQREAAALRADVHNYESAHDANGGNGGGGVSGGFDGGGGSFDTVAKLRARVSKSSTSGGGNGVDDVAHQSATALAASHARLVSETERLQSLNAALNERVGEARAEALQATEALDT
jgi:hypothetical protein